MDWGREMQFRDRVVLAYLCRLYMANLTSSTPKLCDKYLAELCVKYLAKANSDLELKKPSDPKKYVEIVEVD